MEKDHLLTNVVENIEHPKTQTLQLPLSINSKWIINIHIKHETIKLPEENIRQCLDALTTNF